MSWIERKYSVQDIIEKCREAKSSEVESQKGSEKSKVKWKVI